MDDFQNMQEQVEAMENVLETMDNPGTAAILGDIEHEKEILKQKRLLQYDMACKCVDSSGLSLAT